MLQHGSRRFTVMFAALLLVVGTYAVHAQQPVTISFSIWGDIQQQNVWQRVVDAFHEAQDEVRVELQWSPGNYEGRLLTQILGGVAPDVMLIEEEPYLSFVGQGAFLDLTDRFEAEMPVDEYFANLLEYQRVNGRYYALPWDVGLGILFYNREMFDQAGLVHPEPNFDWDELLEIGRRITRDVDGDGQPDRYTLDISPSFRGGTLYMIYGGGGDITDDILNPTKATVNSPESIRAMQFAQDWINTYRYGRLGGGNFMGGEVAMARDGTWYITTMRQSAEFEWDILFYPHAPEQSSGGGYWGHDNIAIWRLTRHPDEAWEFVKFVIGPEGQRIIGEGGRAMPVHIPSAREYFLNPALPPGNQAVLVDPGAYARRVPRLMNMRNLETTWNGVNGQLLRGEISPEEAALRINELVQRHIDEHLEWAADNLN